MTLVLTPNTQRLVAVALAALAIVLVLFVVVMPLWSASALNNERVAMLRRQAQTLEGLVAVAPQYEAIAKTLNASADSRSLVIVAAQPSLGVAELQSKLTGVLNLAGIRVTASQSLGEQHVDGLVKIAVHAAIETEIGPLVDALHDIAGTRPLLSVERLVLREPDADLIGAAGAVEPNIPNKLLAEIVVSAFVRKP